ncbi:MAG TPA: hypothetical protein VMR44_07055 [Thermoanaerobaculia bacterium]|nr:hypothetical protein [Thermoanaerobaculia bacterium]
MTIEDHDALVRELLETDAEFRRLHDEHQQCESRLEELRTKSLLSQEVEIEEKRIKVHKLALKDRMEFMVRDHEDIRATA